VEYDFLFKLDVRLIFQSLVTSSAYIDVVGGVWCTFWCVLETRSEIRSGWGGPHLSAHTVSNVSSFELWNGRVDIRNEQSESVTAKQYKVMFKEKIVQSKQTGSNFLVPLQNGHTHKKQSAKTTT